MIPEKVNKKTIAVDFDGVLHRYDTKIEADEQHLVHDDPVPGAIEWCKEMIQHFNLVVYTARHNSPGGLFAAKMWLRDKGFPEMKVTGVKPIARLYIDDRGYHFTGDNFPTLEFLENFKPWNREDEVWVRE